MIKKRLQEKFCPNIVDIVLPALYFSFAPKIMNFLGCSTVQPVISMGPFIILAIFLFISPRRLLKVVLNKYLLMYLLTYISKSHLICTYQNLITWSFLNSIMNVPGRSRHWDRIFPWSRIFHEFFFLKCILFYVYYRNYYPRK